MERYAAVRRFVFVEGRGQREAARVFGLNRDTVFGGLRQRSALPRQQIVRFGL